MESEVVQIGSFQASKMLLDIVFPLIGVIIGGVVTYLVTTASERQRWRQAKQDRLAEAKREGIAIALQWLDPMELAISRANMLLSAYLQGDMDQEEFMERWPYLLGELKKYEIPARLRVLLPSELYVQSIRIVQCLDEIRTAGVRYGQEAKLRKKPFLGLHECYAKLDTLAAEVEKLAEDLAGMYRSTFDLRDLTSTRLAEDVHRPRGY